MVLQGEKPERPAYAPYVIAAAVIFPAWGTPGIYTGAMVAGSPGFPAPGSP